MANEFVAKNGLISQNNTTVSGSLTVTQGITGSLQGTASWANNALNIQGGTTDYIPLWATNTSLANSYLNQSSNILKTIYSTTDIGLKLDFGSNEYIIGDPGGNQKILINTSTEYIGIADNGAAGIKVEGASTRTVTIGDAWGTSGTNTNLIVDATNQIIKTANGGADNGLKINFTTNYIDIGDYLSGTSTAASVGIVPGAILTRFGGVEKGFYTDSDGNSQVNRGWNTNLTIQQNTQRIQLTGNTSISGSFSITGSTIMTGSLNVSAGITGSLQGTASYALTASYAMNGGGGGGGGGITQGQVVAIATGYSNLF